MDVPYRLHPTVFIQSLLTNHMDAPYWLELRSFLRTITVHEPYVQSLLLNIPLICSRNHNPITTWIIPILYHCYKVLLTLK
jgi:hypothetical protein